MKAEQIQLDKYAIDTTAGPNYQLFQFQGNVMNNIVKS